MVREAIRQVEPPVVVAGWSYGGDVMSVAADGERHVARLVYVGAVPRLPRGAGDATWVSGDPHIVASGDGTFVLDNHWWLAEEVGTTFPQSVQDHLWQHPRRPASLRAETDPRPAAAWRRVPTTVLLGDDDQLCSDEDRAWAVANLADVRLLDSDHFILFRTPQVVADVILEALPFAEAEKRQSPHVRQNSSISCVSAVFVAGRGSRVAGRGSRVAGAGAGLSSRARTRVAPASKAGPTPFGVDDMGLAG